MPKSVRQDPRRRAPGAIRRLSFWLLSIPFALAVSLLLSIAIEAAGIAFGWWDVDHTQHMLVREVAHLQLESNRRFAGIPTPGESALVVLDFLKTSGLNPTAWKYFWLARGASEHTAVWLSVPAGVIDVFLLRLVICAYSLSLMALFAILGLQEGLVRRELRKWGGGAESAFLYHHLKRWLKPLFVSGWFVYLAAPFTVHPNWIWIPLGLALGLIVMATASLWKRLT